MMKYSLSYPTLSNFLYIWQNLTLHITTKHRNTNTNIDNDGSDNDNNYDTITILMNRYHNASDDDNRADDDNGSR